MEEKHIGIKTSVILFDKFRYASKYEGKSANAQIIYMMRKFVNDFEKSNGEISEEDMNDMFGRNKQKQEDEK